MQAKVHYALQNGQDALHEIQATRGPGQQTRKLKDSNRASLASGLVKRSIKNSCLPSFASLLVCTAINGLKKQCQCEETNHSLNFHNDLAPSNNRLKLYRDLHSQRVTILTCAAVTKVVIVCTGVLNCQRGILEKRRAECCQPPVFWQL